MGLYTVVELESFVHRWRRLGLNDDDLRALESQLETQLHLGKLIPGTGGLRKLRFAPPSMHRGKRGATRVIYAYFVAAESIYLFSIYAKGIDEDLSAVEKKYFSVLLKQLKEHHV